MIRMLSLIISIFLPVALLAGILHVPGTFPTIESAIQKASRGDTVLVAPGTYTLTAPLIINKPVTLASRFILTQNISDRDMTILTPALPEMEEWVELAAENACVVGISFYGKEEHSLNITGLYGSVLYCKFMGGKDQLSLTRAGGRIAYCYFENAGDDGIDCDETLSWIIEHNTIVNAHQDGIEIRLHEKEAPLTRHIFRNNTVIGSGQSGIQLIDYQGDSFREFYIHHNTFLNCKGSGVSCMYQEKDNTDEVYRGSLMMERAFVYNNTIHGSNYGLTLSPGLIVLNNIIVHSKTRGIERGIYLNDGNDRSITDHCLFYGNAQHYDPDVRLGTHNLLDRDPLLKENELQKGSPSIDAGAAHFGWDNSVLDIPNSLFMGKAPDLGAREFGLTVSLANLPPVVDAGEDLAVTVPSSSVLLKGSVADDGMPVKRPLIIQWAQVSGPGEAVFTDASSAHTSVTFPEQGSYELSLTGDDSEYRVSDRVLFYYVKDYQEKTFQAGKGIHLFIEAEDYLYLAGEAESVPVQGASGRVVKSAGPGRAACTEYRVSTLSAGDYYIWVRVSNADRKKGSILIAFNNMKKEQKLNGSSRGRWDKGSWKRAVFSGIPEGLYSLRIRAGENGAMWDKLFITTEKGVHPEDVK